MLFLIKISLELLVKLILIVDNYKIRVPVVGFEISLSDSILKSI